MIILIGVILGIATLSAGSTCKSKHSCKLEALGCFNDDYQRAMPEQILNERDKTSKVFSGHIIDWKNYEKYVLAFACRCANIAAAKGYTVIGLQFFGECWSGPKAHETYDRYGKSESCIDGKFRSFSEDKTCLQYIGKAWTNHVYRIAVPGCAHHNIEPIGCFHDDLKKPRPVPNYILNERDYHVKNWNGHLIDWAHWTSYSPQMVCRCAEAAKKRGDDYFAIQFWGECWSGKESEVNFNRNGNSFKCKDEHFHECRCNSYICVGMAYTNYVYKLQPECKSKDEEQRGIEVW